MGNTSGKPVVFTDEVNLNHFRLLRVLGKGAFGKVRVVERKDTGLTFALKYIRKDEVVRSESVRNIIRERRMLEHLNHPFLCNLRYSFQDMEYMYIVLDLMNGGDLRFHISRKTMTEEAVRFWVAELSCALRYIHSQGIVHRDLKPDNVLLDSEGHVHLADFNVASEFNPRKKLHSRSGTLAYLAPEVYTGVGYLSEVDWWSLGVTFYECIYNRRPFESHGHEKLEREIVHGEIKYPLTNPPISQACLHAISSLLEKDTSKRIGAISFQSFTDNPFFRPIDFVALELKQIAPIFVPSSEKTNFDATYDLEELLLEEAPLEARARRQKPRAQLKEDATDKEIRDDELHRMIETMFEPFDYTLTATDPNTLPAADSHDSDPTLTSPDPLNPSEGGEQSRSGATTPNGSPPLAASPPLHRVNAVGVAHRTHSKSTSRPRASTRSTSRSTVNDSNSRPSRGHDPLHPPMPVHGGMQPGGPQHQIGGVPYNMIADKTATMPADTLKGAAAQKSSGMLGFLSRKGGRARSPKPREPGVLGKEGARVVVVDGGKRAGGNSKSR